MEKGVIKGVVSAVVEDKGYGFIQGEDGQEYFFHASALTNHAFSGSVLGADVVFRPISTVRGVRAVLIRVQEEDEA